MLKSVWILCVWGVERLWDWNSKTAIQREQYRPKRLWKIGRLEEWEKLKFVAILLYRGYILTENQGTKIILKVRSTNIIKMQRELLALPFYNTTVSDGCSHSALPLEIEEIPNTTCASQKPKKKKRLMGFHSPYLLLQFVCLGHLNDLHPSIFTTKTRIHSFFLSYF